MAKTETKDDKPQLIPTAQPIQAPFDEAPPSEIETEERTPADPLEHFRKHQCANGHKNWDEKNIVYSMDNKRWLLKCITCAEKRVPSWYTITGSSMAVMASAGRLDKTKEQE